MKAKYRKMIEVKDGKVTLRGTKSIVMAEVVTVLLTLKKEVSKEEYKTMIRVADEIEQQVSDQVSDEAGKTREELKKLFGL